VSFSAAENLKIDPATNISIGLDIIQSIFVEGGILNIKKAETSEKIVLLIEE
jgi:hypothetical protein